MPPAQPTASRNRLHVVLVGGGVAGLEALLALGELAGKRVEITMISPEPGFLYRPVTVAEAFGHGEAREYALSEILADRGGGTLIRDSLAEVRPDDHIAITALGEHVHYDVLVVAAGATMVNPLPGAVVFRGRVDVPALSKVLSDLVTGAARSVALTLPSERMWPLPIYELALMTAAHLREHDGRAREVWLVTPEEEPLELFGPAASAAIEAMLKTRGVRLRTSSRAALVRDRVLGLAGGSEIYADRVITLPQLEGPGLPGLPHDDNGFIPVDTHGRVRGVVDVYAAGDVTSFALKQGGLAAQQADAVAETIAAGLGLPISPKPFSPVLRGLLLTGGAPLYMRAEPQRLPRLACCCDRGDAAAPISSRRLGRHRPAAMVAAREGRRTLPRPISRDSSTYAARLRPSGRQDRGARPAPVRRRIRGRARARADARGL